MWFGEYFCLLTLRTEDELMIGEMTRYIASIPKVRRRRSPSRRFRVAVSDIRWYRRTMKEPYRSTRDHCQLQNPGIEAKAGLARTNSNRLVKPQHSEHAAS